MTPKGWHLDIRATTAILALVVGCLSSSIVIIAGPAGQQPDSAAAILAGFLSALATLIRNTSDQIPPVTVTATPPTTPTA